MSGIATEIAAALAEFWPGDPPARIGVAVSGGSDSMALLHGLWALRPDQIVAATVDHGLRPEAAQEAAQVATYCNARGIPHETLQWQRKCGAGNLMDQARNARYDLLVEWAQRYALDSVALGHTLDDQAETMVMRLARASGVSGLSGMARTRLVNDVCFVRPLLGLQRADLQAYLQNEGIAWVDDPSNSDTRFDRIKVRQAMGALSDLGITPEKLNQIAAQQNDARQALNHTVVDLADQHLSLDGGDVLVDQLAFSGFAPELRRRLVVGLLQWMGRSHYPPRRGEVAGFITAMAQGQIATLNGCITLPQGEQIRICREYNAVARQQSAIESPWDGRWQASESMRKQNGATLRALGEEGLAQCPAWRQTGRPRPALLAAPSVWQHDEVISAPMAGKGRSAQISLMEGKEALLQMLLSH